MQLGTVAKVTRSQRIRGAQRSTRFPDPALASVLRRVTQLTTEQTPPGAPWQLVRTGSGIHNNLTYRYFNQADFKSGVCNLKKNQTSSASVKWSVGEKQLSGSILCPLCDLQESAAPRKTTNQIQDSWLTEVSIIPRALSGHTRASRVPVTYGFRSRNPSNYLFKINNCTSVVTRNEQHFCATGRCISSFWFLIDCICGWAACLQW